MSDPTTAGSATSLSDRDDEWAFVQAAYDLDPPAPPPSPDEVAGQRNQLQAAESATSALSLARRPDAVVETCPLKARHALEIVILDSRDVPVEDAVVELRKSDTEAIATKSDARGLARFESLEAREYQVCLSALDTDSWDVIDHAALAPESDRSAGDAPWRSKAQGTPGADETLTVKEGECISILAHRHGFLADTLWNLPANAQLKTLRKDKNILNPGDKVVVPAKRQGVRPVQAGQQYRLRRKGDADVFRVCFEDADGKPRAQIDYMIELKSDGGSQCRTGKTDADGLVVEPFVRGVLTVDILLGKGPTQEAYTFAVAHLDPIDTISGVQARLENVGYPCGTKRGEMDGLTRRALRDFQQANGLTASGDIDDATKKKLQEIHRS